MSALRFAAYLAASVYAYLLLPDWAGFAALCSLLVVQEELRLHDVLHDVDAWVRMVWAEVTR